MSFIIYVLHIDVKAYWLQVIDSSRVLWLFHQTPQPVQLDAVSTEQNYRRKLLKSWLWFEKGLY